MEFMSHVPFAEILSKKIGIIIADLRRSGSLKAGQGDTDIFITPGYKFQVIDRLITNFHLPKSTLLMLVSAFSGCTHIRQVYQHAVEQEYRFFSYGDAMILGRT